MRALTRGISRAMVSFNCPRGVSMRFVLLMLVCGGLMFSGCGGDSEKASSPQTVTVVERTVTADPPADEAEPAPDTPPAEEQSGGSGSSGKIRVPNVVGKVINSLRTQCRQRGYIALLRRMRPVRVDSSLSTGTGPWSASLRRRGAL